MGSEYVEQNSGAKLGARIGAKPQTRTYPQDIIVDHSLDNDLKVLHLEHRKVVDTSFVFPHQDGPPKRKPLRKLAMEVLNRRIQDDSSSHDSKEDALAALDLVKVKAGIV